MDRAVILMAFVAFIGSFLGSVVAPWVSYTLTRKHERDHALWRHRHGRFEEMIARAGELTSNVVSWRNFRDTEGRSLELCQLLRDFSGEFHHVEPVREAIIELEAAASRLIADRRDELPRERREETEQLPLTPPGKTHCVDVENIKQGQAEVRKRYWHLVDTAYEQLKGTSF